MGSTRAAVLVCVVGTAGARQRWGQASLTAIQCPCRWMQVRSARAAGGWLHRVTTLGSHLFTRDPAAAGRRIRCAGAAAACA
jgi:hypothetical protein